MRVGEKGRDRKKRKKEEYHEQRQMFQVKKEEKIKERLQDM